MCLVLELRGWCSRTAGNRSWRRAVPHNDGFLHVVWREVGRMKLGSPFLPIYGQARSQVGENGPFFSPGYPAHPREYANVRRYAAPQYVEIITPFQHAQDSPLGVGVREFYDPLCKP